MLLHDRGLLLGEPERVIRFVLERLPNVADFGPCAAIGIQREGELIGGVIFNNYDPRGRDIEMTVAIDTPAWWRPRSVANVLGYAFAHVDRITLRTGKKNKAARRCAVQAGFRLEGVKRRCLDGRQDQMIYGLLREDCRYLKGS